MKVKLLVEGGNMSPGPALAQQLGPMGINIGKVIEDVNSATATFKGTKVPVELDIDTSTKEFTISVSSPPVSELLKKELKLEKGAGNHKEEKVGNISIEQVIKVAKTKLPEALENDLKAMVKSVNGTCVSLGILVESKEAVEVAKDIEDGVYDKEIEEQKTIPSEEKIKELAEYFSSMKSAQEAKIKQAEAEKAEADAKAAEEAAEEGKEEPSEPGVKEEAKGPEATEKKEGKEEKK